VQKEIPATKWFDDFPSQTSGTRTEVGLINKDSGYSFSFRDQTIRGRHLGEASRYSCFSVFCFWITDSIVSGLNKNSTIDYSINLQQIWVKKAFEFKYLEIGLLGGINNIKMNIDVSNSSNHSVMEGSLPLPFIGAKAKYPITEKLGLVYELHYSKLIKNGASLEYEDSELELTYQMMDFLIIAIGENKLKLNFKKQTKASNSSLNIPQHTPYLKISFLY